MEIVLDMACGTATIAVEGHAVAVTAGMWDIPVDLTVGSFKLVLAQYKCLGTRAEPYILEKDNEEF